MLTQNEWLVDLPEKMTHEVCCPVGKLAFFPGKLTNTNQILTLVGDDYFIERTVKNTLPTIENRTDLLNAKRLEVEKQLDKMQEIYTLEEMKDHVFGLLNLSILFLQYLKTKNLFLTHQMIKFIDIQHFIKCQRAQSIYK